ALVHLPTFNFLGSEPASLLPPFQLTLCPATRCGRQDLAFVDPRLDADLAHRGMGLREPVVNVGAEGMEWHTALQIPLGPGDLSSGQPARAPNLDALGPQTESRRDAALHGPAERDPLLQLHRHVFSDQLCVKLRLL